MALRDILRNYYYGKPGKRDFTEADLPENRMQLFWQVFGVRKGNMIGLNLLYLVIWIPAIVWTFLNLAQLINLLSGQASGQQLRELMFAWLLVLFPLIAITGPFNAGISLVTHRWAQDEHSFPFSDFKDGMRQNWKQALLFSFCDGLIPLLFYLCVNFYSGMAKQSFLFMLPLAVVGVAACLWFLAAPIMPQLIVSYRLNFRGVVRNAVLMTLVQLPRAIGLRLLTLLVPILAAACLLFFPKAIPWVSSIASILYAMILLAFNKLIWASFANFLGEKYLNSKIPGAPTDIGLRPKGGE